MAEALRRVGGVGLRLKLHLAPPHEAVLGPDEGLAPKLWAEHRPWPKKHCFFCVFFCCLFFVLFFSFFVFVFPLLFPAASMMNSSWSLLSL